MNPSVEYLVLPYLPLPQDLIPLILDYVDEPTWDAPLLEHIQKSLFRRLPRALVYRCDLTVDIVSYHEYLDFCTISNKRGTRVVMGRTYRGLYMHHLSNTTLAVLVYAHNHAGQTKRLFDLYVDMPTMRIFTHNGGYVVRLHETIYSRVRNVCWNLIRHDPSIPGNQKNHELEQFLGFPPFSIHYGHIRAPFFYSLRQTLDVILRTLMQFTPRNES